jgi:hypothetical protein
MPTLVSVTEVSDFDTWKPGFERFEALRNQNGVSNPRIFRLEGDANKFVIVFDVDDIEKALSFLKSDQARESMKSIGVTNITFALPSSAVSV